jgi:hypothetical protein
LAIDNIYCYKRVLVGTAGSGTKVVGEFKNLEFCGIENK